MKAGALLHPSLGVALLATLTGARPVLGQESSPAQESAAPTAEATLPGTDLPATLGPDEALAAAERAIDWLVETQNADGSWGWGVLHVLHDSGFSVEAYYDYQMGAHGLGVLALLEAPPNEARHAALEQAVRWLCTTRMPKRGSDWDIDYVWAALYGTVALAAVADDGRFQTEDWRIPVRERGDAFVAVLERTQIPTGGWAYYDNPPYSARPKWGTSFCTALILPALERTLELGWLEDPKVSQRAKVSVRRSALPNGAFQYSLDDRSIPGFAGTSINNIKGSLGRTAVCLWGLATTGERTVTPDRIREALANFMEHHRFLDVARMRPYPHEAYYANAGYFYFFAHYYTAELIELLPQAEREAWHARLRPHLVKVQYADGSSSDFQHSNYSLVSGTAYLALALLKGLPTQP